MAKKENGMVEETMDEPVTDEAHIAIRLEAECPWEGCAGVLSHAGWLDVVDTIKTLSPEAYAALRKSVLNT